MALRQPEHVDGRLCFLDARSSPAYYHWMLDVVPKIHLLTLAGIDLASIDQFVVRAGEQYQIDTLVHLGISRDRIRSEPAGVHFTATELVVPFLKNDVGDRPYKAMGLGLGRWVPEFVRQAYLADPPRAPPGNRIFISRSHATSRRLVNGTEVDALLRRHGFVTVDLGSMSVAEQAETMANAAVVVGVHGGGLTNLAFCPPGTRVLELFGEYVVPCYWALASLNRLEYHRFMADSTRSHLSEQEVPTADHRGEDLFVDVHALDRALQVVCNPTGLGGRLASWMRRHGRR
ncbi:MAG: glycosyltransferase family 61 protein [Acidimicrobiales bacterium]|nr:glycosyltransferase family 61 protein [Acidimicrobiales bacterium]